MHRKTTDAARRSARGFGWTTTGLIAAVCALAAQGAETVRQTYEIPPETARANEKAVDAAIAASGVKGARIVPFAVPAMSAVKRMPDAFPSDGRPFGPLFVVAAQGEYEPASFLLYSMDSSDGVQLKASDLKGKAGASIPAAAIDLKVVKVWYQGGSAWYGYFSDPLRRVLVPELLLKDENLVNVDTRTQDNYVRYENIDGLRRYTWMSAPFETTDYGFDSQGNQALISDAPALQPFVLNKGEFKQFFATVHVPKDSAPGVYEGRVDVVGKGGAPLATLPLRVRVLPFELPSPKTCYDLNRDFYFTLYGSGSKAPAVLRDLAAHNLLNPMGFPSIDPMNPEALAKQAELARETGIAVRPILSGIQSCGIAIWGSSAKPLSKNDLATLAQIEENLSKTRELTMKYLGHADFYSYGIDEGGPDAIRAERRAWRIAHDVGGKVMVSTHPQGRLLYDLDLMAMPGMPCERRAAAADAFHKANPGALVGWYADPHTCPENPDYARRLYGMMAYKAGYDLDCNYCFWRNNWNDFAVPWEPNIRAIVAVYGARAAILDTLEWEGMREGLDDIRYATLLSQLATRASTSPDSGTRLLGRQAFNYLSYWDGYRDSLDEMRLECINYILRLRAALN